MESVRLYGGLLARLCLMCHVTPGEDPGSMLVHGSL